jgi:hypothetical protein
VAASSKAKLERTIVIEQEPKSKGGRRFAEVTDNGDTEVFGRLYVSQAASTELGGGSTFKVTIEAV